MRYLSRRPALPRALGLDAAIGFHVDQPSRDSLACDLMEPVRPLVDSYLVDWLTTAVPPAGMVLRATKWERGVDGLAYRKAEKLTETAPIWARAVAPVAWVAQAIWSQQKKASSKRLLPTRLTQRRRSEERGDSFRLHAVPVHRRAKLCEMCGAASRVAIAGPSQSKPLGRPWPTSRWPLTQDRKLQESRLSDHAVAISKWSASNLHAWRDEECYVQKIQPQLKTGNTAA